MKDYFEGIREILKDSDCWTRGKFARDATGTPVCVNSMHAVRWCLSGACHKVIDLDVFLHENLLQPELARRIVSQQGSAWLYNSNGWERSPFDIVTRFNDDDDTEFEDIQALLKEPFYVTEEQVRAAMDPD